MTIEKATEEDFLIIKDLARSFDLDCEELSYDQFLAAKINDTIIGFGRLKKHPDCTELATLGTIPEQRNKGVAQKIAKELIRIGPDEIYISCVIPTFFEKIGFKVVKQYPLILEKKVDFCKSYNFTDDQIFIMKFVK